MEIIIGRDAQTAQLSILVDGQPKRAGQAGSVPQTVSRKHLSLTLLPDGTFRIRNLKAENTTYVNGLSIGSKVVTDTDTIQLGPDHYVLSWQVVRAVVPRTADIRPLRGIDAYYREELIKINEKQGMFNAIRGGTGLLTMLAIVCSFVFNRGPLYLCLYALAIIVSLFFFIKSLVDAKRVPRQRTKLGEWYEEHYVCPCCKHHFPHKYKELVLYDACPFCRAKFVR